MDVYQITRKCLWFVVWQLTKNDTPVNLSWPLTYRTFSGEFFLVLFVDDAFELRMTGRKLPSPNREDLCGFPLRTWVGGKPLTIVIGLVVVLFEDPHKVKRREKGGHPNKRWSTMDVPAATVSNLRVALCRYHGRSLRTLSRVADDSKVDLSRFWTLSGKVGTIFLFFSCSFSAEISVGK